MKQTEKDKQKRPL